MKDILFDSDVLIDHLRGVKAAQSFFESAERNSVLYLSVVPLTEIYSGKDTREPQKFKEVEKLVGNFEISLITSSIAKTAGLLRRDYQKPFADMLIAATVLEYGFIWLPGM